MASLFRRIKGGQSTTAVEDAADQTSISTTSLPSHPRQQQSRGRKDDPLGLVALHEPAERTLDIVFIHGLGGTSKRTWCYGRDLDYLWPQLWLPQELPTARILTFGYNADFSSRKDKSVSSITDFARDLLYCMKYGENTHERLGQVPIVVIAHSMGGLVFKKAFIQGHNNDEFHGIVSMIKAVLFLATPHHGTDLAKTLNRVLSTSFFGHSPKEYIAELDERSRTINELNENFRQHAVKLRIFSFYETLETELKVRPVMIVEKASAVIGYADEIAKPLNANHHTVCKFSSPEDPNYTSVVSALRDIYDSLEPPPSSDFRAISDLLGIAGPPDEDIATGLSARTEGTCHGFLKNKEVIDWLRPGSSQVLWVHSPPGSGKSVTCAFLTEHLLQAERHCSYFFFRYKQLGKQSSDDMLRSLAYQLALQIPEFRRGLAELFSSGARLANENAGALWKKAFLDIFATFKTDNDLYWVIDGLDECGSAREALRFLLGLDVFRSHVHVLVFSRHHAEIQQTFHQARAKITSVDIPLPNNSDDIRLAVTEDMDSLVSSNGFKGETINEITARSQQSFLWARLVTKNMLACHREDQIKALLTSTPDGMSQLYDGMIDNISNLTDPRDKSVAKTLLAWAMYAKTPITLDELSEVYPTSLGGIIDRSYAISQLCGQFVVLDTTGRLTLLHHSAREYLKQAKHQPHVMDEKSAGEEMTRKCLDALCDKRLRQKINTLKVPKFLPYASTLWAAHLEDCSGPSMELARFLDGPYPLPWIHYLAMSGRLSQLYNASRVLYNHAEALRKSGDGNSHTLALVDGWATDLMRIAAKYGRHLSESPTTVYTCIPALCPSSSMIHQKFSNSPAMTLSVSGLTVDKWDDCIARLSCAPGRALRLAVSPSAFAVVSDVPKGTVTIRETGLFQETKSLGLGEHIWAIAFNKSGTLFACYTFSKSFVWKTADWSLVLSVDNPRQERTIEFTFDEADTLMSVSEQSRVYSISTAPTSEEPRCWERLDQALLDEPNVPAGTWLATPSCVALSYDCTQMAVAYRNFPLSIWSMNPPEVTARLRRNPARGKRPSMPYTGDTKVVWHRSGEILLGISGRVFKWFPVDNLYEELEGHEEHNAHGIQCSPSGRVFATTDGAGLIRIYDTASMSLMYQMGCGGRISQVCFASNSTRLYDLRKEYCNVWEPECVVRLADALPEATNNKDNSASWAQPDSDAKTVALREPAQSEPDSKTKLPLAVINPGIASRELVACVDEGGSISLYSPEKDKTYQTGKSLTRIMLQQMFWCPARMILAHSKANGAPAVASAVIDSATDQVQLTTTYDGGPSPQSRGQTRELLLNPTGTRLLVSGANKAQLLSLPDGEVLGEEPPTYGTPGKWDQYPSKPNYCLCFTGLIIDIFTWLSLQLQGSIYIETLEADTDATKIDAILDNHCPRLLLLRTATIYNPLPPIAKFNPYPSLNPWRQQCYTSSASSQMVAWFL
ncbi:hypothetical protein OQA88_184 [Cercophora sp. LCS_1]